MTGGLYSAACCERWNIVNRVVPDAELQALLSHEDIVTLDELPSLPWANGYAADGDFDFNGSLDCADADQLVAAIAAGGSACPVWRSSTVARSGCLRPVTGGSGTAIARSGGTRRGTHQWMGSR